MSWFTRWFGYGLGVGTAKAIFGKDEHAGGSGPAPIRNQSEEEIRADEKRFDEDERKLDAADAKRAGR
jgi:hypothetical protein